MDIVRQVELRCMGHRLAAEYYTNMDNGFKIAATILAALSTSASYWSISETTSILNYCLAGLSTLTTVLNAVLTMKNASAIANHHRSVAKALDLIRLTYISDLLDSAKTEAERDEIVDKMRVDVSNILKDAPLLDSRFEMKAQADLDHRDEMSISCPPSPRRRRGMTEIDVLVKEN